MKSILFNDAFQTIRKHKIIADVTINNRQFTNRPVENKEEIGMRNVPEHKIRFVHFLKPRTRPQLPVNRVDRRLFPLPSSNQIFPQFHNFFRIFTAFTDGYEVNKK